MKETSTTSNHRVLPYDTTIPDIKFFNKRHKILENIKKLHSNAHINQKSNILSIVAYNSLKKMLRTFNFNFSDSQFSIARNKRKEGKIGLNNYKRHVPYSKRKVQENVILKIEEYLLKFSRQSSREVNIHYLNRSKKDIYRAYIAGGNQQISYSTFLKKSPKKFKKGVKWTDLCGICELSKKILKKTI